MGDFIIAILVTLATVMIPVINYSNGIDTTFIRAFVQSKNVEFYYYFWGITVIFLVADFLSQILKIVF